MHTRLFLFIFLIILFGIGVLFFMQPETTSFDHAAATTKTSSSSERMLLVLAAPVPGEEAYANDFSHIVDFHVNYARAVMTAGHDDAVILVSEETRPYYAKHLDSTMLIDATMYDIWMRDFTTVNPNQPVEFVYTDASMSEADSVAVQQQFDLFADRLGISRKHADFLLDGGNVVDNYAGDVIVTTRFLEDNDLGYDTGVRVLKETLGANRVAIIPSDDEVLAHADGMVMWVGEKTLLINDYAGSDEQLRTDILRELHNVFPDVTIVAIPFFPEESEATPVGNIASACGIYVNAVMTPSALYVPTFGTHADDEVLALIRSHTDKSVIPIAASGVCHMGGSVRCLTWQLSDGHGQLVRQAIR